MLHAISDAMSARATAAADERGAGHAVPERRRIHAHRKAEVTVWHLDDLARALYPLAGGVREPEAHFGGLPATEGLMSLLKVGTTWVEERDAGQASRTSAAYCTRIEISSTSPARRSLILNKVFGDKLLT